MMTIQPRARRVLLTLVTLGLALAPLAASAQLPPGPKLTDKQRKAMAELRKQVEEIGPKLGAIQRAAAKKHPKLAERGAKLQALVEATMKKQGVDPNKLVKRLQSIQSRARGGTLDDAQKKKLMQEFMQARMALQMAEQQAMKDKKVAAARKVFQSKLEAAMIKTDPKARKLLRRFKRITEQLQKLVGA